MAPQPSPEVQQIEDATANSLAQARASKTSDRVYFPERPGFGTLGQPVLLYTNYFELTNVGKDLFRYHVDVIGDEEGRKPAGRKLRRVVGLLLEEHFPEQLTGVATDYRSTVVSIYSNLVDDSIGRATYDVRYKGENDEDYSENPKVYRVNLQKTGNLKPSDLLNYLSSTSATDMYSATPEVLQAMNIVLGFPPKTNPMVSSVGANKHYSIKPNLIERLDLGGGLEALRGFFISVRAATARLLLNVQVKYATCYQAGELTDLIFNYRSANPSNIYKLENFLKRVKVQITHTKRKNGKLRTKTVAGLASTHDGRSQEHPPRVRSHGAGPADVEFYIDPEGEEDPQAKRAKKSHPAGPSEAGHYVSVAEFFLKSKFFLNSLIFFFFFFLANLCSAQQRGQSANTRSKRRKQGEADIYACRSLPGRDWTAF